jgi:hypothetical protein
MRIQNNKPGSERVAGTRNLSLIKWDEAIAGETRHFSCVLLAGLGAGSVQYSMPSRGGKPREVPLGTGRRHWR